MGSFSKFSGIQYDVFISSRGTDTRHGFLSHLRKELRQKQIDAYVDGRLESGDKISPALLRAIKGSLISLIIFSSDYASSKCCLEELVQIIECMKKQKQIVIPVFYNTDPSNVRRQKGSYGDALAKHGKYYEEKVPIWRSALKEAANLSGFHSSNYGDEAELIEETAKSLSTKLNILYRSDFTDLVGISERIAELESLMNEGSKDVRVIGIWGMGGIGKTTIAAAIFNRFCFEYEGHFFLANVREESANHGIIYLKNKILSSLLKENDLQIGTPYGMPLFVRRRLLRKRVLVVLDDISDSDQLENLVGALDCFGSGSRIFITTRDKQVLAKRADEIYEVKPLMFDAAAKLFMLNAFGNNYVDIEWIELSRKVISYAKGIPLALKVLGSFLYGKSKEEWENQLEKLNKMPHAKIQDVMRLSYDKLDREEKNIFLYIACFLKGYDSNEIILLLNACGFSTIIGLKVLRDKALITEVKESAVKKSRIFMHDLIQEMGWEIVREESIDNPGNRSRLWDANDIYRVLKYDMGTTTVQSITLNVTKIEDLHISPKALSSMDNLKFLNFYKGTSFEKGNLHLPCGLEFLSNKLRFLRWDEYPSKSLPATFSAENIVTVKMNNSKLRKLWDGVQNLANLREIFLTESEYLIELPDFSKAKLLKNVNLSYCTRLCSVHPSILTLPNLSHLRLSHCKALTSLTSNTSLKSLTFLALNECSRLREFSVTSEKRLKLFLSNTAFNDELCSSSGHLGNIEDLSLDGCQILTNLPYKLVDLSGLRYLSISGCNKLASNLHFLLDRLRSLENLLLNNCSNLFELPENISLLSSLCELSLTGSTNLTTLPASVKHLLRLQCLRLDKCKKLQSLPELPPSIANLSAMDCTSLETLKLSSLPTVTLEDEVCFHFGNCRKLDQQSIKAIEAKALLEMDKLVSAVEQGIAWSMQAQLVYPGTKVPEWFMYRSTQSSVTVDLFSIPQPKDWSFIFCAVVSHSQSFVYFETEWYFSDGQQVMDENIYYFCKHIGVLDSDNVCLWYISDLPSEVQRIVEEKSADKSTTNHRTVEIKFVVKTPSPVTVLGLKGCGVCPTGASGYRNYIQQMESVLQSQPNSVGAKVGCSCGNTDDKEVVTTKSKDFIFPTPPTVTWKNRTQGLKDIIFL